MSSVLLSAVLPMQALGPAACVRAENGGDVKAQGGSYNLSCSPVSQAVFAVRDIAPSITHSRLELDGVTVDARSGVQGVVVSAGSELTARDSLLMGHLAKDPLRADTTKAPSGITASGAPQSCGIDCTGPCQSLLVRCRPVLHGRVAADAVLMFAATNSSPR